MMDDDLKLPRPPSRPLLPPVSTYLSAVFALGRASIAPGFPALAFFYFYRLGMGLYLALSVDRVVSIDDIGARGALMAPTVLQIPAYIPVLVLIYMPFLLLQDGILRGTPSAIGRSMRAVLERVLPLIASGLAQIAIVFGPPILLLAGAALLARSVPTRPEELTRAIVLVSLVPCIVYIFVMLFFLWFALPALVLDKRGPLRSIRLSFGLVATHFGGLLGRILVTFFLVVVAAVVLAFPAEILQVAAATAEVEHPVLKIAVVVWTAAVAALLFPFMMASVVILYRALVPAAGESAVREGATGPIVEAHRVSSPFQFE
jgi:hypothetical protein